MSEDSGLSHSPTSPEPVRKSRKSGVAAARRLSRASTAAGLPFEDLLATLPSSKEANTRERLEKLLQLVVTSTSRDLVDAFRDHEDDELEEAAKNIRMKVKSNQMADSSIEAAVEALDQGVEAEGEIVGGELKKIREYTKQLEAENEDWKKFMSERKEMLRNAKNNVQLVKAGELAVEEDVKWTLNGEERRKLERVTEKINRATSQLQSANTDPRLEWVLRDITAGCVQAEAEQEKVSERLGQLARMVGSRAESLANNT